VGVYYFNAMGVTAAPHPSVLLQLAAIYTSPVNPTVIGESVSLERQLDGNCCGILHSGILFELCAGTSVKDVSHMKFTHGSTMWKNSRAMLDRGFMVSLPKEQPSRREQRGRQAVRFELKYEMVTAAHERRRATAARKEQEDKKKKAEQGDKAVDSDVHQQRAKEASATLHMNQKKKAKVDTAIEPVVLSNDKEMNDESARILSYIDEGFALRTGQLDGEWNPFDKSDKSRNMHTARGGLHLLQICIEMAPILQQPPKVYLFRLCKCADGNVPDKLKELLTDPRMTWMGSRIRTVDARRLEFGHNIQILKKNLSDLGPYAASRGLGKPGDSLATLYQAATGTLLAKSAVRTSKWNAKTLSPKQRKYAAMDVIAALRVKQRADEVAAEAKDMELDHQTALALNKRYKQNEAPAMAPAAYVVGKPSKSGRVRKVRNLGP
jgi:hypothetical protein